MEKVVFDNFFHFFHELLRKSLESLSKTTFSNQAVPRIVEEVFGIIKMVEKIVKTNFFQLKPFWRPKSWKKLFLTIFSTIFMIPKTSSTIRGKSGKSCQKQLFPRFGPPKRLESWKKLFLTTFSTIFMIPKTSSTIRGKSGECWPGQHFPRQFPLLLVVGSLQTF